MTYDELLAENISLKNDLATHEARAQQCIAKATPLLQLLLGGAQGFVATQALQDLCAVLTFAAQPELARKLAEADAARQKAEAEYQELQAKLAAAEQISQE